MIIEPPENQYILEGTVATLFCKVHGARFVFWSINGNTIEHEFHRSYYEGLGVIFAESNDSSNLTMTVPASVTSEVNNIHCIAQNKDHYILGVSDAVRISVFKSFRKSS